MGIGKEVGTVFKTVDTKFERAEYFLEKIKTLPIGNQPWRACLEAFFFELISAKDFFLQEINDKYAGLPREQPTYIKELKKQIKDPKVLSVLDTIKKTLKNKKSLVSKIKHYRNSATHRELLQLGYEAEVHFVTHDKELFDRITRGEVVTKPILEGQENKIPADSKKADVSRGTIKTYLFKDPQDSSKGNADIEVIPYCEQSLKAMRDFLEELYAQLS